MKTICTFAEPKNYTLMSKVINAHQKEPSAMLSYIQKALGWYL